jgi:hypothetical protein
MTEHSAQTPSFPNGSIDMNALHDAAVAGKLGDTMPERVMLLGERSLADGEILADAADSAAVQARLNAATPQARAAMATAAAPLAPIPVRADTTSDPA